MSRLQRLALGNAAGLAIAAGASWLRVALAGSLRIDTAATAFWVSSLLLGAGLGLSGVCAWRLMQLAPGQPRRALLWLSMPGQLLMALAAPITSSDFYQYVAYGLLQAAGKNPLAFGPDALGPTPLLALVPQRWLTQPSVYGPVMLAVFRATAFLGELVGSPLWGTAVAMKLAMTACTVFAIGLAARMLSSRPGPQHDAGLAAFAFSPLLAWELTGQGHSDAVVLVALVAFVWAATSERPLWATLAITAAALGKLTLLPILALYLLFLLRRGPVRAVAYGLAALALSAALMIPYVPGFPGFGPFLSAVRSTRSHSLGDLLAILVTPLGPAAQELAVRCSFLLCIGLCAAVFATVAVRARTVHQLIRGGLVFLIAWDMTVPLFQTWYISWLFPLALVDPDARWMRLVSLYGIWSVLQWIVPLDPVTTVALDGWVVWQTVRLLRNPVAGSLATTAA